MSVELQQVKHRIGATRQIRKVTSAMQRVAAARLINDRRTMECSHEYTRRLREGIDQLMAAAPGAEHPLLVPHAARPDAAVLVFGSDRGLCGAFHSALMDQLDDFTASHRQGNVTITAIGKVIGRRCRRAAYRLRHTVLQPARERRASVLDALTTDMIDSFLRGEVAEVFVLYSRFVTALNQTAVIARLLPVSPPAKGSPAAWRGTTFEPEADALLGHLLSEFVRQSVDHAYLSSLTSENAARQTAMGRATENATEILTDLLLHYSRLRQESITTEMIELAGGGMT